jgi:hypothetical protein
MVVEKGQGDMIPGERGLEARCPCNHTAPHAPLHAEVPRRSKERLGVYRGVMSSRLSSCGYDSFKALSGWARTTVRAGCLDHHRLAGGQAATRTCLGGGLRYAFDLHQTG